MYSKRDTQQGQYYSKITAMGNFRLQFMDTSSLTEKQIMVRYKETSLSLRNFLPYV